MLQRLSIRNIVLITALEIEFGQGFCVLTGETGAGKSILLDALSLALGMRAETRLLRHGEKQGSVTAVFDVTADIRDLLLEAGVAEEEALILRRVLYEDGKSKAFINDAPVSIALLQKIGDRLVEIHGQHDQRGLLNPSSHRVLLDMAGGLQKNVEETTVAFAQWKEASALLAEATERSKKYEAEQDYLSHVLQELKQLNPEPGEEKMLAEKRALLMQQEKIAETLNNTMQELVGECSINERLRMAERMLSRSALAETGLFDKALAYLERASAEAGEAVSAIEEITATLDSGGLEQTEERLFALRAGARKYQREVEALAAYRDEVAAQLHRMEHDGQTLTRLKKEAEEKRAAYITAARILSEKRRTAAEKLAAAVEGELKPLKMAGCRFRASIESLPEEAWAVHGMDKIAFEAQTNSGQPFGALHKIASGGELSRFMLAMKVALSGARTAPTLIFDEIDAGVGGAVAAAIGQRLSRLGRQAQVLAITHLPQVAACGDSHYHIAKKQRGGATYTEIVRLDEKTRKEEMARMLAGATITDEARAAAGKLMAVE